LTTTCGQSQGARPVGSATTVVRANHSAVGVFLLEGHRRRRGLSLDQWFATSAPLSLSGRGVLI